MSTDTTHPVAVKIGEAVTAGSLKIHREFDGVLSREQIGRLQVLVVETAEEVAKILMDHHESLQDRILKKLEEAGL